jgi:hypothetical protein
MDRNFITLVIVLAGFVVTTRPSSAQVAGATDKTVHVNGYTKKDGTSVAPYNRSAPNTAVKSKQQVSAGHTSPAPRNTVQGAPNSQPEPEPTKIIAIYRGRGYFDPALAEEFRLVQKKKLEPAAGQNVDSNP